jgi:hypothetical protein
MIGGNRKTISSVRGRLDMGLNCARGVTKWKNLEIRGTWILGYSGFMNDVKMRKGEWIPQPKGEMGCVSRKRSSSRVILETEDFYNYQINKQ